MPTLSSEGQHMLTYQMLLWIRLYTLNLNILLLSKRPQSWLSIFLSSLTFLWLGKGGVRPPPLLWKGQWVRSVTGSLEIAFYPESMPYTYSRFPRAQSPAQDVPVSTLLTVALGSLQSSAKTVNTASTLLPLEPQQDVVSWTQTWVFTTAWVFCPFLLFPHLPM